MAAAQPLPKRRLRPTGMKELASNCGDTNVDLTNCSVRSELGFDVYVECFSLQIQLGTKMRKVQNVPHKKQFVPQKSKRSVTTPVDPAGPHCYRCLLYTSPSPRDGLLSRMPSSA